MGSLLGGNTLSSLASALGRFTGQGSGSISSLLALLAPIVLGVLKSRTGGMGSDANALASLFAGQRQNIISAMPRGLSDQLASARDKCGGRGRAAPPTRPTRPDERPCPQPAASPETPPPRARLPCAGCSRSSQCW